MRRDPSDGPAIDTTEVEAALAALEETARRVHASLHDLAPESQVESIFVPLRLELTNGDDRPARALEWIDAVRTELRESVLAAAAFRRGRVFCLRCESATCEHSQPPTSRAVFSGYGQTGRPNWTDFDLLLSAVGDPRVAKLYEQRRALLTQVRDRDAVYAELLPGFEAAQRRYLLLGQLTFGLLELSRGAPGKRAVEPMALTIQIVRSMSVSGPVLGLNLVGRLPPPLDGRPLDESKIPLLTDSLRALRRELAGIGGPGQKPIPTQGVALERLVARCRTLLRNAAKDLEHRHRAAGRRTLHAQERASDPERPTAKALEEALAASPEQHFLDREKRTFIVLGKRSRVHIFTMGGKHVTSVTYSGNTIRERTGRKRWITPDPVQLANFRLHLEALKPDE